MMAESREIFIPKQAKSEDKTQFRTISVLNVEGKIFFSVMTKRMTLYDRQQLRRHFSAEGWGTRILKMR